MNRRVFLTCIVLGACTSSAQARRRWRRLRTRRKQQAKEEAPGETMSAAEYEKCRAERKALFARRRSLKLSQRVLPSEREFKAFPQLAVRRSNLAKEIEGWQHSSANYNARCTNKFHRFNGQWFRSPPLKF